MSKIFLFSAAVSVLAISSHAHAQSGPSEQVQADSPSAESGVEEIVVTAQRRQENLQNVPIAITALSSSRLAAANISSAADISALTPSLSLTQVAGTLQPHIRGVGTSSSGPGIENPVATYVDGVYIASGTSSLITLNNIERIEVLKGPQGTLFGRNATGGLIHIITRDPSQDFSAETRLSYGNFETVVADAFVNSGLTDKLAANLALRYEHQGEGWGRNLFNGKDVNQLDHDFSARVKFLLDLADTKVRVAVDYADRKGTTDAQHWYAGYPITFNNPGFGGPYDQGGPYDINKNKRENSALRTGGISAQINHDFGAVAVQSLTAYRKSRFQFNLDLDLLPVEVISTDADARAEQLSQELQFSSIGGGPFKWVGGVFLFSAKDRYDPLDVSFAAPVSFIPGVPVSIRQRGAVKTHSAAVYGQASYEIMTDTTLTLGGRFTYEDRRLSGTQTLFIGAAPPAVAPLPIAGSNVPAKIDFQRFNYRIALDHKITPDILIYASYNTGFKSGGYNLIAPTSQPYKPENIKAFEAGLKSQLFDRRLRLNLAGYYYKYSNLQVTNYAGGLLTIVNGAAAKIYGFDLDADFRIGRGLSLNGGLGYIHDRFTDYPNAPFFAGFGGCAIPPGGFCSQSANGNKLGQTPTWSYNVGTNYNVKTTIGSLDINILYSHTSRSYGSPDNFAFQPSLGLLNASIQWTSANNALSLRLWGKNLTDKVYATGVIEANLGVLRQIGAPRTYGVTLGTKF